MNLISVLRPFLPMVCFVLIAACTSTKTITSQDSDAASALSTLKSGDYVKIWLQDGTHLKGRFDFKDSEKVYLGFGSYKGAYSATISDIRQIDKIIPHPGRSWLAVLVVLTAVSAAIATLLNGLHFDFSGTWK